MDYASEYASDQSHVGIWINKKFMEKFTAAVEDRTSHGCSRSSFKFSNKKNI